MYVFHCLLCRLSQSVLHNAMEVFVVFLILLKWLKFCIVIYNK
jgi:hypothetical protein